MASELQIAANRRNALSSTGPRTDEGKSFASTNAVKHGLTAGFRVFTNENQDEFDELAAEYRRQFNPTTIHETHLVEELAQARWRLARARRLEAVVFDNITMSPDESEADWHFVNAVENGTATPFHIMQRYIAAAERTATRALKQLQKLRAPGPAPAPVEIAKKPNEPNFQ